MAIGSPGCRRLETASECRLQSSVMYEPCARQLKAGLISFKVLRANVRLIQTKAF